jgi:hypothetical protein
VVPFLVFKLREHYEEAKDHSADLSLKQQYLADQEYEGNNANQVISEVTSKVLRMVGDGAVTL